MGLSCKHLLDISWKGCLILSTTLGEVIQGCVHDPRKIFIVLFPAYEFPLSLSLCFMINLQLNQEAEKNLHGVRFYSGAFPIIKWKCSSVNKNLKRSSNTTARARCERATLQLTARARLGEISWRRFRVRMVLPLPNFTALQHELAPWAHGKGNPRREPLGPEDVTRMWNIRVTGCLGVTFSVLIVLFAF